MKKNLYQLLLPLLLLASWGARAQTPLQSQSFENGETMNYTASTVASGNSNIYFTRASLPVAGYTYPSGLTNIRDVNGNNGGTYFWASENVRRDPNAASPVRANPPANLTLNALNVTGKSNFSVKVALADAAANNTSGTGWETNDFVRIQYRFDGGTWANANGGQFVGTRNEDTGVPSFGPLVQDADGNGVADSGGATLTQALTDYTFAIPGSGSTLEVRVQIDQDGASEEFGFDAIRVYGSAAASAAPVLSNLESTALNYAEGQGAVPITNTLTISDDGTTLTGARVAISANFQSSEDQLVFINQNGITGSYNTGTGVLTMSGTAAVATYQAALRSIQYQNTDTKDASPLTRTVSFSVTDATNVGSNTVARNIAVTTALDTPGGLPYAEDLENGDGEGTRYATNKATATLVNGRYFNRTNVTSEPAGQWHANGSAATTISGINNSYYWWVSGSSVLSGGVGTFTTKQTNTAGYYNLNFSVKLAASNNVWENGQYLRVSYRLGGSNGTWQPLLSFRSTDQTTTTTQNSTTGNLRQDANPATTTGVPTGTAQLTPTLTTYSAALPASANGQLVDFRIEALSIASDGVGEVIAFDNLQLTGSPIVAPTVTTGTTGTITTTTAAVNNNTLSSDGGASLTDYGVVYVAGTGTPTTSNTKVQVGTSSPTTFPSSFAANLTGLTPGTQYTVRAYATNSVSTSYGANVTFTTATPTITLAPASPLPGGTVATAYSQTLTASGGTAPYSYAITAGALPAGLTLTSAGVLSGTPTAGGTFSFRVNATDAAPSPGPFSGSQAYSLTIAAPTITVAPASLPNGATNTTYSQAITASGGTAPYSYAITAGALPAGLTLTAAGVLSGTPTASGSFTFTVTATDASTGSGPYRGSRSYTLPIANSTVTVTSVTRLTPSPTATATVSYRVVFSGTVTGLSTSNFSLTTTGLTGATISALSGSGTTYTVVVNTGTGNGTLRLDVANSTGTTPSITNVPYTAGEEYTIAKDFAAAPTLRIQAAGSAVGNSDVTAFVDVVQVLQSGTSTVVPNGVQNGSFETNNVATNFKKTADGVVAAPWTFTSTSGISRNGGDFASTAFDGTSVALIQSVGDNNASISQNLAVPTGSYQVSFQAIQRNYTSKDQRLNVFLVQGGNTVFIGNIQPNGNFPPTYDTFTSASFSVTAPALVTTVSTSSASPTSSSLIPFGVSFTASGNPQSVGTTFTASDVTVSGGTLNAASFSGSGAGPYTFTVTPSGTGTVSVNVAANVASDANNTQNSASNTLSVQFVTPTITVAPAALPDGTRGTAYSQTLSASGGTAPYTYAITAGALPVGLSLSSAGVLAGTPAVSGTFTFTVTATDNSAAPGPYSGSRSYTLSIAGPAITLAPATLPAGTVAVAYSQTVTASGGTAPYTYAITAGALPAGLTLTSAGVVAGTPTAGGTFNFTVTAFDASTSASGGPYTGSRSYALTIAAPTIAVGPTSLPNGTQGTAYSQALSASGGTAPYTYAITAGALPSGLSLSSSGTIAGTPTTNGTFNFTVTATDASTGSGPYTGSRSYTLVINSQLVTAAPVVTTPANNSFSNVRSVTVTGTAPAGSTVSIYIGSNLAGTTPASATGAFSYLIPGNAPDGTYTVSATAQSSGATASASSNVNTFTIDGTAPTVALSSATVASGSSTSTSPVSFTATFNEPVTGFTSSGITVTNGTVTSGPTAGSGNTYTFQVTPRGAGNVTVTVLANAAQDRAGNNNTASSQYAFTFVVTTIAVGPATLPNGTQNTAYSQALTASGGMAPYTYAITAGALPSGLTLSSNGTIAGTPTTNGNFNFTVTATDASAAPGPYSGARSYTLTISTQPVTAAPVVTAPANGSLTNSNSVTYQGTAPAGSTVTVYVDGASIGVTTATGGNWSLVQPTALAQGSHTVYATAQASGSAGSANSNTNTFTVDSVRPSVAISSSAGASGGSTSTSPIPYTVTFSKNVTGFVAGDVSVTGGTLSGFTAVSGITYTFNVTPSTSSSTVTVNIAANVAVDQANNGNTAASQYSLTFAAPTITVGPASLPNGTQGTAYSQALSAAGGTAPYSYSITSGALPAGLSLNLSNGTIAGTPTANGTFNFTVTATDASIAPGPYSGSRSYTLTVAAPAVTSVTWTGAVSTDWFNASNWSPSQVPDATIDAVIPTAPTGGRFPVITSNTATAQVRNLTINSGATLTQTNNVLALAANLTNNGTFRATSGTVILGNTSQSNILGASNTRFWNLTVGSNGAQQSTSASTSVQRLLTLNGNFAINGNPFTLESNASNTAMVVNNGSNVLTGNVTVQRFIDPSLNPNLGYHHFSSPISNATVGSLTTTDFTPVVNDAYNTSAQPGTVTPFPTVYGYDQARLATATNNLPTFDKGWFSPSALSNPLAVGQGYTVNLTANQAFSLTGPQNNGNVALNLARNTGATAADAGLALVGNPYPSPLDWSQVAQTDRPGLDGVIYVFTSNDPTNPYAGSYSFYNNGIGSISPVLPLGQGFFVRVSNDQAAATLTFKNSHRPTTYSNNAYRRTAAETRPLVQLTLKGTGSAVSDDAFVYFEQGSTEGFDAQYDAVKLPNPNGLNLSASVAGKQLSIDGLPELGAIQRVVPLAVGVPAAGSYSLSAAQLLNLDATPVYLRDLQAGTLTDLRLQPSYQFTVSNASALITGRFELVFSPQKALATVPAALAQQVGLYPNPAKTAAFVELPASLGRQAVTATLVDALGRVARTVVLPAQGALAHQLDLHELPTGIYALRLSTSAGVVVKRLTVE